MSNATLCPSCHSTVQKDAKECWLCKHPMQSEVAPKTVPNEAVDHGPAWAIVVVLAFIVIAVIGVELALYAPGLAIVYLFCVVPVCGVLARIAWVQRIDFWNKRAQPRVASYREDGTPLDARGEPVKFGPSVAGKVLTGLALAASMISVVIGLVILVSAAAIIILMLICFGIIAMDGGFY